METNTYNWSIKNIKSNRISISCGTGLLFLSCVPFFLFNFFITLLKHTPISEAVLLAPYRRASCQFKFPYFNLLNESF